ncbi:MAG: C_GCAxxG_C_C family protein [Erysipelotrichaceae bacterium]|nr:C_GCAxxG_C_C family protein [Erysipelotrichaceae bacterium]
MNRTVQDRMEQASALRKSGSCNCAQAILETLKDQTDLDKETLHQLGAGFGGGMGNMEATCGSLIAANMILGLSTKGEKTLLSSRKLIEGFKELSGATKCRDLKQMTDGKPLCSCDQCVRNAISLYCEIAGIRDI